MASIVNRPNGHRWIQFIGSHGRRSTLRLGKVSKREAEDIKLRIERLLAAQLAGHVPDVSTSKWIGSVSHRLRKRLSDLGLVETAVDHDGTLDSFLKS